MQIILVLQKHISPDSMIVDSHLIIRIITDEQKIYTYRKKNVVSPILVATGWYYSHFIGDYHYSNIVKCINPYCLMNKKFLSNDYNMIVLWFVVLSKS